MKMITSNPCLSLIVSGVLLSACSSSSDPAPAADNDVNSPVEESPTAEVDSGPNAPVTEGGSVNAPVSGTISQVGTLNFSYQQISDQTDINASFFQINVPVNAAQLQAGLESENFATNSCELSETAVGGVPDIDDIDIGTLIPDTSSVPTTISAGEVLTITSPAGTFASLVPTDAFGFLIYGTPDDVGVAGSVPAGTTADIPGLVNSFPGFANVAVPSAGPLDFSIEGTAQSGFTMTWNGSDENNSGMFVNLLALDQSGSDISSIISIECALNDDGAHTLEAGLLPSGGNVIISSGTASRRSVNLVQQSEAVLLVTSSSVSPIPPTF